MIVSQESLHLRSFVLRQFIKLAWELKLLHNYNTSYSIVAGLNSSSVSRLKKSWEVLFFFSYFFSFYSFLFLFLFFYLFYLFLFIIKFIFIFNYFYFYYYFIIFMIEKYYYDLLKILISFEDCFLCLIIINNYINIKK